MQVSSNGDPAFSFVVLYNAHQAWLHIRGIHPRGALWSIWSPSECTHSNVQSTPANSVDLIKIPMEDVHTEIPQNIYFMGYEHDHDDADSSTYSKVLTGAQPDEGEVHGAAALSHNHNRANPSPRGSGPAAGAKSGARKQRAAEGADLSDQISRSLSPSNQLPSPPANSTPHPAQIPPRNFSPTLTRPWFLSGLLSSGGNGSRGIQAELSSPSGLSQPSPARPSGGRRTRPTHPPLREQDHRGTGLARAETNLPPNPYSW
ncbi:hypothetical protein PCANC_04499 [Puccinia coronata f. sp. avenae]|uniref:Uncharacterized protein n=1 Tax=Puccinia coronata f. sp. avenae TaxID=200324 RepID=A0A2N5VW62_9BASI|nr:hypothetical protein PCANC_04499 [Puccinia coronata f. sp. avenae]